MRETSIHNVRDLGQDARQALESLLGRRLAEEEQVSVTVLPARPAPSGDERRVAAERLHESLKAMSERAKGIPDDELESLIDEAMDDVRRRRSESSLERPGSGEIQLPIIPSGRPGSMDLSRFDFDDLLA